MGKPERANTVAAGLAILLLGAGGASGAEFSNHDVILKFHKALPGEQLDFSGRDLSELDLSGLVFKGAQFAGANLFGTDRTFANLKAPTSRMVASTAPVVKTDFSVANLSGVKGLDQAIGFGSAINLGTALR